MVRLFFHHLSRDNNTLPSHPAFLCMVGIRLSLDVLPWLFTKELNKDSSESNWHNINSLMNKESVYNTLHFLSHVYKPFVCGVDDLSGYTKDFVVFIKHNPHGMCKTQARDIQADQRNKFFYLHFFYFTFCGYLFHFLFC